MSNVTQWHGCYDDSWNGVLVPDAFAHPAKFAPGLISRILRHMLERGHAPGDIRQRFMRLTQRPALALRLEQAARHLRRQMEAA